MLFHVLQTDGKPEDDACLHGWIELYNDTGEHVRYKFASDLDGEYT